MPTFTSDPAKPLNGARARIRMYRVGLGDCFLLSVAHEQGVKHMLIDCGMFAGSRLDKAAVEKDLQIKIVNHIAAETNKKLDVLVVTHEHMDHVSIFNSAKKVFETIQVEEVWFGWVESDTAEAKALREKYEVMEAHLAAALTGLAQLTGADKAPYDSIHDGVTNIAEFLGFNRDGTRLVEDGDAGAAVVPGALGAAKVPKVQPRAAMDFVKARAKKQKFGSPGDVWEFGGLKVYVLGPPPNETQMKTLERAGATYDTALGALGAAAGAGVDSVKSPFGEQWRQPVHGSGAKLAFDESVIDDSAKQLLNRYLDPHDGWRRIDLQSLESAPTLALQMDNYINNTSLALAFEFPGADGKPGDVMLFPGDAQVGNWEWWFQIKKFDVKKLLDRTVFYKVGHHGSHNATLKQALELMNNPRLVAMMPTNESFARNSKHWNMPATHLREKLLEHTRKRVLRNDQGMPGTDDPMHDGDWGELKDNVKVDDLFIEYYL
jgi:beta-lactamase superfamily II metal-dependent hydrolase